MNSPPPKPEVILTNFFAEPTVLLVPITSRGVCMYVYNISGGVGNIFYQSCAQIDNSQQVYEAQIQVPRCNSILKAVHTSVKKSGYFILIDVRVSTQITVPRQLILMSVCCPPFGQDLAFG